jgi:hypothetical protein
VRALFLLLFACGSPRPIVPPEAYFRVGVDVASEARAVEEALVRAGYTRTQRIVGDEFVALAFVRTADDHRAVRVVTRNGLAVLLDSHESDGVRVRHGDVRLIEQVAHDIDGDGRPEIVVARDGDPTCIAVLRVTDTGAVRAARIESGAVAEGACASSLEDIDGDRRPEALVTLAWPELSIGDRVPSIRAVLVWSDGAWIANGTPEAFAERERTARITALERARNTRDLSDVHRLAIELAAIANLTGAPRASQLARYDEALAGLVLREEELARVREVRARIAAGWAVLHPDPETPSDHVEEGTER